LLLVAAVARADDGGAEDVAPDPDAPTVGAALDKSEAHVGDRLTLTVSAVAKAGIAVTLPGKLELGKLELLDRDDGDRNGRDLGDGRRSHRFVLGVAAYEVGELEVPAIQVHYLNPRGETRTVETAPVSLKIRGLVAEDEAQPEVQPIRPPRHALVEDKRVMRAIRWGAVGFGGLLVLGVAVLLVRRALRRADAAAPIAVVPTRPPDEVAMAGLRALRAAGKFEVDGYRPFYYVVAEIMRAYLGGRYGFDSLELTTTELMTELAMRAPHLAASDSEVARFFGETDLVKFAKAGSTDGAALAILDAAEAIVRSTAPKLEPATAQPTTPVRPPNEASGG
jgi:hypothetical protein